jgi:hypothetical protein
MKIAYIVKFDRGYYANKQPNYHWSFTKYPSEAKMYTTLNRAESRGKEGIELSFNPCKSYKIEKVSIDTKVRKPRTTGSHLDFDGAHQFGQPCMSNSPAVNKLYKRMKSNLCLGCGKNPCVCKSKG